MSPGCSKYLESLGLDAIQKTDVNYCPPIAVAELRQLSLPPWKIATIFTVAFAPSTQPDTIKLECLTLELPHSIHDPGRLGPARAGSGWIIDPQLQGGRLVKRGIVVQMWAMLQPRKRQLEVYKEVIQHAESREEWKLQLEKLHVLSVDDATWDFGDPSESDCSDSETDQESDLVEKLGGMKVQTEDVCVSTPLRRKIPF